MDCPKCGAKSSSESECTACGVIFSKFEISRSTEIKKERQKQFESLSDLDPPFWFEVSFPLMALLIVPILRFVLGPIMNSIRMWTHELGHAFAAWFGGIPATPFLGFTAMGGGPSWIVTICFSLLLGFLTYKSWEKKAWFLVTSFVTLFVVQLYVRIFVNEDQLHQMIAFMGVGGEFWISAWLMLMYHYRLPDETYWQLLRYPVFVCASSTFITMFYFWWSIGQGRGEIPWGSIWGPHGDMDALQDAGWGESDMLRTYLNLGYTCATILIVHYFVQVARAWSKPKK